MAMGVTGRARTNDVGPDRTNRLAVQPAAVRIVEGPEDQTHVVVDRSSGQARLRMLSTGEERRVGPSTLTPVDKLDLEAVAAETTVDPGDLSGVHSARGRGLVALLAHAGPVSVRVLVETVHCCESDLNGLLAELQAGGVIESSANGGNRSYRLTEESALELDELLD